MDPYQEDIDKLKEAYRRKGYYITNSQAESAWPDYSETLCASWLMMGDDLESLFECTKEFLIVPLKGWQ